MADWVGYYAALDGRPPRPLLERALAATAGPGTALDIGFGDGTETVALLAAGWWVQAIDPEPAAADRLKARLAAAGVDGDSALTLVSGPVEDVRLQRADLAYAGYSLPFVAPAAFDAVWSGLRAALRPGGVLAVNLFGPHDSWAADPTMTFHDRTAVGRLVAGLDVLELGEIDEAGEAVSGPKHWHVFEVLARRPDPDAA